MTATVPMNLLNPRSWFRTPHRTTRAKPRQTASAHDTKTSGRSGFSPFSARARSAGNGGGRDRRGSPAWRAKSFAHLGIPREGKTCDSPNQRSLRLIGDFRIQSTVWRNDRHRIRQLRREPS
jgi:hypothetical protein